MPTNQRPKDPDFIEVLSLLKGHKPKDIARDSNDLVGKNTIYNWQKGKVRRPQHYTIQAALRAIGWEYKLSKKK